MAKPMTAIQLAARMRPHRGVKRKPTRLVGPRLLEGKYTAILGRLVAAMGKAVSEIILPQLPAIAPGRKDSDYHLDQTVAEIVADLIQSVNLSLDDEFAAEEIARIVEQFGAELNSLNRFQVHQVFKSVLGVDLLSSEPVTTEVMAAFVGENVSLITSVREQFLAQVEQVILRGVRSGLRHESIASQLLGKGEGGVTSRLGVSESRAALIARDQTNKFYGQLTELRQEAAGVEAYIWRTALDERVRDEHRKLENTRHRWDDPPSEGHPGEPINCRCYAEPVIPGVTEIGS